MNWSKRISINYFRKIDIQNNFVALSWKWLILSQIQLLQRIIDLKNVHSKIWKICQIEGFIFESVENILVKGEIVHYKQYFLLTQC